MRICITGGPRTGKTTLANRIADEYGDHTGVTVAHTDDVMDLGWSEASLEVSKWLDAPGPWIIEGVAVSRALRKWHASHPGERPPIDKLIVLSYPWENLTVGQHSMAMGIRTVTDEIMPWLRKHGVTVEHRGADGFTMQNGEFFQVVGQ